MSLVVLSIAGFASNQLLDEDAFARLISESTERYEVRELLATKAVDVAIDASDADAALAEALPAEISLIATPALELSKPAIARAGAELLGIDAVGSGLETAARSVHRQTSVAILAEAETDVLINTLPVLVVVADEIAGDVGARAAVGLNLPDSATSINLGSNTSPVWSIVRSLSYLAAAAALLWLVAMIVYFVSAPQRGRLMAARRLGRTFVASGVVVVVVAWLLVAVSAVALEVALAPGDAITFGRISLGGLSAGGGAALAEVLFGPLISSGRRMLLTGLVMIGATYALGQGAVAVGLRALVRRRDEHPLAVALRSELPKHVRQVQRSLTAGLAVLLLIWPQITLRVALTLAGVTAVALAALAAAIGQRAPADAIRRFFAIEPIEVGDATERTVRAATERRWLLVVTVIVLLVWPSYDQGGFTMLAVLVSAAFALTYRWELRSVERRYQIGDLAEGDGLVESSGDGWSRRRKLAIAGVVVAGVASLGFGGEVTSPTTASAFAIAGPATCNGHAELCDVPLDEVVLPGTHNSMSASELDWELANHGGAIPAQLDAGVRALLIDVQYWPQGASVESLELDPEAAKIAASALAIDAPPEDGLWMCHKLCELGGTPFGEFLADLRVFLETNPDQVLVIVIQDEAPADDIVEAIEGSRVDEFAFTHVAGSPWPTLGDMIEANRRVVFLAENEAHDASWYQLAFDGNVSETGFRYSVVEDFDCSESRGGTTGDFFMINHWVETGLPIPAEADTVNSAEVLHRRIEQCLADRGRAPGIIAVNFWERGDLFAVVDALNGVAG